MRLRKSLLRCRVNAPCAFRFEDEGLTSFSGLELIRVFLARLELPRRLREGLAQTLPKSDYSVVGLVLLLLALLLTGGRRISHVRMLIHDRVVSRFCGLATLPTERTVSRWLGQFDEAQVDALSHVHETVAADVIRALGLTRLTLDVDGSVVSTGMKVDGACRGYNPHRRKVPSYFPITAYEAQSGMLLRVENRPGNVHDGKAALGFLRQLVDQVHRDLPEVARLEFRLDGSFFLRETLEYLEAVRADYAIKVPFWTWLDLRYHIAYRKRWYRVSEGLDYFETEISIEPWSRRQRVILYRKKVHHRTAKNYQLDLFDPDNGSWEYSAIATNKSLEGPALWAYMSGRGTHEKVYGELKSGFAFDSVPSLKQHANSAWQVLSVLAFNLSRALQASLQTPRSTTTRKRAARVCYRSIQTLLFEWLNRAGRLARPNGRATLDVGSAPGVRKHFSHIASALGIWT
jgi:hypothetical protein